MNSPASNEFSNPLAPGTEPAISRDSRAQWLLFLLLPAVAMSLGWGLRGTIGGGQIGAMIPGAMVALCLCHLLGWTCSAGVVAAFGAVGVGLGGQETYGQTIGFLREPETVWWGLAGLTLKGAMWGLPGGALIGLGFMRGRYRTHEIVIGLALLVAGTAIGWRFVDHPKLAYFSNRVDEPREEVWVGLTLGGVLLAGWLACLRRESVSLGFAWRGYLAGGAGFGIGGLFIAMGDELSKPYHNWPWWKVMEFTFGLLFGLGLGAACWRFRKELRDQHDSQPDSRDFFATVPLWMAVVAGLDIAVGGLRANFLIPFRASYSVVGVGLILLALLSNSLAWHIALSMTITGFFRDGLRRLVEDKVVRPEFADWRAIVAVAIPVVLVVTLAQRRGKLTVVAALLGLTWLATAFGLLKVWTVHPQGEMHVFVPAVFVLEAVATSALVAIVTRVFRRVESDEVLVR